MRSRFSTRAPGSRPAQPGFDNKSAGMGSLAVSTALRPGRATSFYAAIREVMPTSSKPRRP